MLQKPRYSDGDLTLIYYGGEECSSGFQRMSVISFECNHTAGERGSALVGRSMGAEGWQAGQSSSCRHSPAGPRLW